MPRLSRTTALLAMLLVATFASPAIASTAFTYQGVLKQAGTPVNGTYDLEFRLFAAPTGGTSLGTVLWPDSSLADGLRDLRAEKDAEFAAVRAQHEAENAELRARLENLERMLQQLLAQQSEGGVR